MNANIPLKRKKPVKRAIVKGYLLIVINLSVLSGCNNRQTSEKQVVFYNEITETSSLDPAFSKNQSIMWPVHQLYNTLVEIDSSLNIVPPLAKSWEISGDRLTYIFHLGKGIYFHNNDAFSNGKGRELTASDIVYSFKRIIDKITASSGPGYLIT